MKNLKALRQNLGLTQQMLSEKVGISKATLSHYEAEISEPNISTIIKLSDFFGCSIDYLLGHQSTNILQFDSLTPDQQKLFRLIQKLDSDTTKYLVGYFSNLTGSPLEDVTPRPTKKDFSENWDENF